LSIVGLHPDGVEGLSAAARRAIADAEVVAGSQRQLELVAELIRGERWPWPSPLALGIEKLWTRRGRSTCVLASGDPFFYGIGVTLRPQLQRGEFVCYPAPSSMSLAAARLGWALQDTAIVSLHGRDLHAVIPYLTPGRRVLALSWNEHTPRQLADLLTQRGFGPSTLYVLEALGSSTERVRQTRAAGFAWQDSEISALNLVALEIDAEPHALSLPSRGSLPDRAFEHDGQLTKQPIRALTLSALAPIPGALLWDVGAGSGSIAIEWLLSHRTCRAIAIEQHPERAARIARNSRALGVPRLSLVQGEAPAALRELPTPDAIFIGGGAGDPGVFEACFRALRPGATLVINAVSLESEALLLRWYKEHGGELCRISIEHAEPLGSMTGFRPARSVTQWRFVMR
jgi:precorrin-6Y C5,15-methyltransferase (decarboxylating)